tara:strand:- start:9351 stop:9527 length:177 start_codon:yes stop_codon:yes gene_type:complete
MEKPIPRLSYDLIDLLDELYPPLCIRPGESLADANRYAGQREIVDRLLYWKRSEEEGA